MAAVGALAALLLAVTTETAAAAPTWHQQGPPGRRPLNDVSAPDDAHAWAVGQGGQILATADGGDSWVAQDDPSINTNNLFGVDIVDAQHGWAVGLRGTIIATTDGGAHWTGQDSGTTETLRAVDFVSSQQGWAVGAGGRILTTDDGGAEWTLQAAGAVSEGPLTDVSFADAQHGWAVGFQPSRILATTDGGEHWAVQSAPGINAQGVAAVDDLHAWAVGVSGKILATTDGGTTWAEQESGVTSQLEEVSFVDAQHGWAVGAGGTVLATEDGGATWAVTNLPGAEKLTGVDFPDATHGIVVGEGQPVFNYYEPGPVAGFEVTAPSSTTAGQAIDFSVTARDASGHVATGFTGEVEFFTMGPDDTLPPKSTLTEGTGQFTAVLREAGAAVIGVRSPGVNNGFSDPIEVKPAAATHFLLVGVPGAKSAGGSIQFGVTARDEFENTVTNFVRTINITTTDPQATATVTPRRRRR
jgi:photosystem II stability/assembly factor-like uncharacterized protein